MNIYEEYEEMGLSDYKLKTIEDVKVLHGTDILSILALKKHIPQKPIENHYEEEGEKPYIKYKCLSCHSRYQISKNYDFYCSQCGQRIDWD